MEGDLPGQANAVNFGYVSDQERLEQSSLTVHMNNRSSILEGASLPVICGGEVTSSAGDHNRITITIRKTYPWIYVLIQELVLRSRCETTQGRST